MSKVVRINEETLGVLKHYDKNLNTALKMMIAERDHLRQTISMQKIMLQKIDSLDRQSSPD